MACLITDGLEGLCGQYTVGGNNRVILLNKAEIASFSTIAVRTNQNALGTLVMWSGKQGYEISARSLSIGETSDLVGGGDAASAKHFSQVITFTVEGLSQEVSNFIYKLGLANVVAIIVTNESNTAGDGNRIQIFGLYSGLDMTASPGGTGTAKTDLSGAAITLTGAETYFAKEVITADNDAFLVAVTTPAP